MQVNQEREDEYLTRDEAALLLGVHVRTIDRHVKQGSLKGYTRLSKIFVKKDAVLAMNEMRPLVADPAQQLL